MANMAELVHVVRIKHLEFDAKRVKCTARKSYNFPINGIPPRQAGTALGTEKTSCYNVDCNP